MAGRKPKPTNLKLLTGNPGKRPINKSEPKPDRCIPAPPEHLSKHALVEWGRITEHLFRLGLLSDVDRAALAAYCQTYGRWVEAEGELKASGLMIKTTNGNVIQSPLVGIANKAMELMHKFLTEFGMTPSSRSRIGVKPSGEEKQNPFGALKK